MQMSWLQYVFFFIFLKFPYEFLTFNNYYYIRQTKSESIYILSVGNF